MPICQEIITFAFGKQLRLSSHLPEKLRCMTRKDKSTSISPAICPDALKLSFRNIMEPLLLMFNKAACIELNNKPYYIAYSIPGGVYGYFKDYRVSREELDRICHRIRAMINSGEEFKHEVLDRDRLHGYFEKNNRHDIVHLLNSKEPEDEPEGLRLAHLNGYGELLLNHINGNHKHFQHDFRLLSCEDGFFLIADPDFFDRVMPEKPEQSKYFQGFYESEETMKHLGIENFAQLNDVIREGRLPEFVKLSETWQARRISRITDDILTHPDHPRVILLAGPTSSGKTTSAHRLSLELKVMKKEVIMLSLDNYYLPHSEIAKDPETGMKNFELITALDLELFRENINDLLAGKAVHLPKYHFDGEGARPEKEATRIGKDTYIIVEGIHGLNPELWHNMMDVASYRLYVSALSTLNIHDHLPLSTSDHRLVRRLVRDHLFRGYDFNETICRWPDVMQNEAQSIFPFQEKAHAFFNSALIYEPAVFAHYAPTVIHPAKAENDMVRNEVKRLNRMLGLLTPIDPKDIPPTSILREFIGGSSFNY
ncbi:MAG: nucleoside kinase [Bacteroidales bacterium]